MAAHLARHMNTTHGGGVRRRKVAAAPRMAVRRGSGLSLEERTIGVLNEHRSELLGRKVEIDQKLAGVDAALAALGGASARVGPARSAPAGRGKRGRPGMRAGSLKFVTAKVLSGKRNAMMVREIESAVRKAGYKTRNKTLGNSLSLALSQMAEEGQVVREGRGLYRSA
jgi:hypothetical protein